MINGAKSFITNSGTDITVPGHGRRRSPGASRTGAPEISAIIVPAGTPGLTVRARRTRRSAGAPRTPTGWRSTTAGCPAENLLGERGRGYAQFLRILDEGRIAIAALSVGLAQGCIDECLRYVDEREAFGHKIGEYQVLQFKIADMEARTHTARLAWRRRGRPAAGRQAVQEGGRHRQAGRLGAGHGQRPRGHPDLRRLRLHERVRRSAASTATPRSWRSARAPPRCSGMLIARSLNLA